MGLENQKTVQSQPKLFQKNLNKRSRVVFCFKEENKKVSLELKFEAPTWSQVYNMLLNLAEKIRRNRFRPDIIVGVSRGGWPPARVLSDLLGNPNLANVKAEFYLGVAETKGEPILTPPVSVAVAGKKVLIVDEVADTGKSLELVKKHIVKQGACEVEIVTVYYKPWSVVVPDYYGKETSRWIVFPWEIKETIRKIVKKCREKGKSVEEEIAELVKAGVSAELARRFLNEIVEEENC
ncbi:phosphoribosyltransferase [Candidatus Bathyarchaeota archaeon]|nr:phosphoribosyltransferase [Candidatus Bathyarchaeota archaeon]